MKVVFVASGVVLAVLGIVGIVVGAVLPNIVEDRIISGMKDVLPRDIEDEEVLCPGSCEPSTKPNDVYVFNITNAKDVLETGAKPLVTQHKFSFTVRQTDYALDYDEKTDSIGSRTLTQYLPNNKADYDTKFITINPVYVGAVAGQAGSENGLLLGLVVPGVIATLSGSVGQIADAVGILQVGSYVGAVLQFCGASQPDCIAAFNANSTKLAGIQPTLVGALANTKTAMEANGAQYGEKIVPSLSEFSLGAAVDANFLPILLSDDPAVGLLSSDASTLWLQAVSTYGAVYAQQLAAGKSVAEATQAAFGSIASMYAAAAAAVGAKGATLSTGDYGTVLAYLGKVSTDPDFKAEVLTWLAIAGDAGSFGAIGQLRWKEPVNTIEDLIYSQIGSGALLSTDSLGPIVAQPAFEFFASQSAAVENRITITGVEAKQLFDDISNSSNPMVSTYCNTMALGGSIDDFAKYGVKDAASALAMANYLCKYLPQEFFAVPVLGGGVLKADGTNNINGGLFVERTLKEIMHGYDDPLYAALGQPQTYTGLLSQGADNVTAAKAKDTDDGNEERKDRRVAGTKDLDKIDYWVEAEGLKSIEKITDFPGYACPNPAVYTTGFAFDCKLWGEKEQIEGVPDTRWPPLNEDTPVEDFEFYVHDLKRSVKVTKDEEEVELHKIRMVRYRILDSEDKRPEDVEGDEAKKRAEKYLPPMSGFIDLQRAQDMVPILIGFPRHSANEAEAEKIAGVTPADWEKSEDDLTTYFDVEPLTGVMMGAHKRLQYNMLLKNSNFDAFPFYKNVTDDQMAFPILWLDDYNFISEEDAAEVNEAIFDMRTQFKTVSLVAIIISVVNCVAGAALVLIGMKSDAAGELSNRS